MKIELRWPDKTPRNFSISFLQKMLNRLAFGVFRYGKSDDKKGVKKRWMKRMEMEIKAYKETGNGEHLVNVANYAMLEFMEPGVVMDTSVESVTRSTIGR